MFLTKQITRAFMSHRGRLAVLFLIVVGAVLGLVLPASSQQANTYLVYGPENFTRANGYPVIETRYFPAAHPGANYIVRIHNGGINGQFARSSAAYVKLNDLWLAQPPDFNEEVGLLERSVTLTATNKLEVKIASATGSGVTVEFLGYDSDVPTITATAQPGPNDALWNNGDVTVTFNCNDVTSGINSCTPPVTVSTDGANQTISGTAVDRAGHNSTASVTLSVDKTAPSVSISSPANGATVSNAAVTVSGSVTESLSGIASVTCNGTAATLSGANFSCSLTLQEGPNTIEARATDVAGNVSTSNISVTFDTTPPTVTVPDLTTLTHVAAWSALSSANLTRGTVTTANSNQVTAGRVISQSPAAGTSAPTGSPVAFVLSLGAAGATPAISFNVDSSVTPNQTEIAPLTDGVPRRLASVIDHRGNRIDFVENELVLQTSDTNAVQAFVARWQGQLLRTIDPTGTRLDGLTPLHHVRINPNLADAAALVADLRSFTTIGRGNHRVTNDTGLRLLAATQMEMAGGLIVTPNWVFESGDIPNGTTTEGPNAAFSPFGENAFNWPYMNHGSVQDMRVGDAWRALHTTGRINNLVKVMILDSGFDTTDPDLSPNRSLYGQIDRAGPAECPGPGGSGPCPWHGTAVAQAGMGLPDNSYGVAGPGGPVADLVLVGSPSFDFAEIGNYIVDLYDVQSEPIKILNMSFGFSLPAALTSGTDQLMSGFGSRLRLAGTLPIANSGNFGKDVDATDCVGDPFSQNGCIGPRWEEAAWLPCESAGVMCVGGLAFDSRYRAFTPDGSDADTDPDGGSNWSSVPSDGHGETVDMYGPFTVFVGTDPTMNDTTTVPGDDRSVRSIALRNGTSYSAPFVSGVAALVWAANPNLTDDEVEQILIDTANTSPLTSNVPRWVNAYRAVLEALPDDPPFVAVHANTGACADDPMVLCVSRGTDLVVTATVDDDTSNNIDVVWQSDRVGQLGSGRQITRNDLDFGAHVIRATATDVNGFSNYAELTVRVENDQPPTVQITQPTDRAVFPQGQDINLVATSSDPNNVPTLQLPDANMIWLLDDATTMAQSFATGHHATLPGSALTPGGHTVRVIGIDWANLASFSDTDIISFTVTPNAPLPGQPPTVTINQPNNGASFIINDAGDGRFGANVTFGAVPNDAEDAQFPDSRFIWTTRMNGGPEDTLGTGVSLSPRLYNDGVAPITTHDVTVYLTDSDGHVASASVRIYLISPDDDGDGVTQQVELSAGTNPNSPDTDGDNVWDGAEMVFGTDPLSAASTVTSIPNGILLGQSGADLIVINPATGFFGVLGRPTLFGFGMAFNEAGTLFIADNDRLRIFEPISNISTEVGVFGAPNNDQITSAQLAYNPVVPQLYGLELPPTLNSAPGQLVRIDDVAGTAFRNGAGAGVTVNAIAFRPNGMLFATIPGDPTTDRLVELDQVSGTIVRDIGPIGFPEVRGLAFDLNGVLFGSQHISNVQSRLLTIDPATGAATAGPMVFRELFNLAVMPCAAPCLDQPPVINLPYAASETYVADLNHDSNPDIVTGNGQVLLGDGAGNFNLHATLPGTQDRAAVGDLDLDGDQDIVLANRNVSPQTITVYLNDGAANFTQAGSTYSINGSGTLMVEIGDLNGDGFPDLAARGVIPPSGVAPHILPGLGLGLFGAPTPILSVSAGRDFTLADVNSDGSIDFVSTGLGGTSVYLNNGAGTFTGSQVVSPAFQAYDIAVGDLNGDGHKDIALAVNDRRAVAVTLSNGNGGFDPVVMHDVGQQLFGVVMGDLTGDGFPDLVPSLSPSLPILNNNRRGQFRRALRAPFSTFNNSAFHVTIGDVDRNGWPDLIVSNVLSITVLLNHDPY